MRLLRYGDEGRERVGIMDGEVVRDLTARLPRLSPEGLAALPELSAPDLAALPAVQDPGRIGACIEPGGKIVCVGLNYVDHARESGMEVPVEPILFMKGCRLSGPHDPIQMPPGAEKVDWEVELAVVIGREVLRADEAQARAAVAGYATFVDMSERDWQMTRAGQWVKGKSWPSFAPLGPWLVTPDEVPDVQALPIWLSVNGERVQDAGTGDMIVGAHALVVYVSQFMPLYPGDVIATGTPPGVGMGLTPPRYLKAGDEVRAGIEGLGEQRHRCVASSRP